jgi:hypothetical protein
VTWSRNDYDTLAALVFRDDYPGNFATRGVAEIPNGDGKVDDGKKIAHVAHKYRTKGEPWELQRALSRAHWDACEIAQELGVSFDMLPRQEFCALRVLYYPANVGGHLHTDFDLFAVNLWRSHPNPGLGGGRYHIGEIGELVGLGPVEPHYVAPLPVVQLALVYFAMPSHDAILPSGQSVGQWVAERIARSRVRTGSRHE